VGSLCDQTEYGQREQQKHQTRRIVKASSVSNVEEGAFASLFQLRKKKRDVDTMARADGDCQHHDVNVKHHRVGVVGVLETDHPCPEKKKANRAPTIQETGSCMPDEVYPLIWNFLLEESNPTESGEFLDHFYSIASFMLVSKASKEAFDASRGWWHCARALKREADAKDLLLGRFEERCLEIKRRLVEVPHDNTSELQVRLLFQEANQGTVPAYHRLYHIQQILLPRIAYCCGEQVSVDPNRPQRQSVVLRVSSLLKMAGLTQEHDEWITAGRISINH
jgi:hypothetical protein